VRYIISSSAIAVKNAGTNAEDYGRRRVLGRQGGPRGPTDTESDGRHAVEEGGGSSWGASGRAGPLGPTESGSDGRHPVAERGRHVVGWDEKEGYGHRGGTKEVCRRSMSDGFRATAIVIVSGC